MKRFLIALTSFICLILPTFAGIYEDAIRDNKKVVLYFYTQSCGYCKKFDPIYNKLLADFSKKCKFVKINADSYYGRNLSKFFGLRFVPYVVLVEQNIDTGIVIAPSCLLQYSCSSNVIDNFVKR